MLFAFDDMLILKNFSDCRNGRTARNINIDCRFAAFVNRRQQRFSIEKAPQMMISRAITEDSIIVVFLFLRGNEFLV